MFVFLIALPVPMPILKENVLLDNLPVVFINILMLVIIVMIVLQPVKDVPQLPMVNYHVLLVMFPHS